MKLNFLKIFADFLWNMWSYAISVDNFSYNAAYNSKKMWKLLKFALVGPCLGKKKASRGHTQHQVDNFYANITKREN